MKSEGNIIQKIRLTIVVVFQIAIILMNSSIQVNSSSFTTENKFDDISNDSIDVFEPNLINRPSFIPLSYTQKSLPETGTGINWINYTIIDQPYQPITPRIAIDSNNNSHLFWSNYRDGRSLYHQIIYRNGTIGESEVIYNKSSGEEIKCDAKADIFGNIHLVYSWGSSASSQKTYYQKWMNGIWSETERVDFGLNEYGAVIPAHSPELAISKDGNPHVLWSGKVMTIWDLTARPVYYQRRLGENQWSQVVKTGYAEPGNFKMIITPDDIAHVILSQRAGNTYDAYHRIYYYDKNINENSWGLEEEILIESMEKTSSTVPTPELIGINNTVYCYLLSINSYTAGLYKIVKSGQSWSSFSLLTTNISIYGNIRISGVSSKRGDQILTWPKNDYSGGLFKGGIFHQSYIKDLDEYSDPYYINKEQVTGVEPTLAYNLRTDTLHLVWWDYIAGTSKKALFYREGFFDTDLDGLSNEDEINIYGTNPNIADTDGDLLDDGQEIVLGLDPLNPDEDSDLILDGWEINYGYDPFNSTDAGIDLDSDGLTTYYEFTNQTNPNLNDTDSDSLLDGEEVFIYFTNPIKADSDDDLLLDGEELFIFTTDPLNNDTDSDGMPDGYEIFNGLNPLVNDSLDDPDFDTLTNYYEYTAGTNPFSNDTDSDLLSDYEELIIYFTNPLLNDTDGDGLDDHYEIVIDPLDNRYQTSNIYQTDPLKADTDMDLLSDYFEINISLTNPINNDTDFDLMTDGYEWQFGLNPFFDDSAADYDNDGLINYLEFLLLGDPFNPDTDNDRVSDYDEYLLGTDLNNGDTDGDGLTDYLEFRYWHTNATNPDTDYDGLNDLLELYVFGSSPFNPDTDGDGLIDGDEVYIYGSHPAYVDTDGDQLTDPQEIAFGSLPYKMDSDDDGMLDFFEYTYGFDPLNDDSQNDPDGDNLINLDEFWFGSNPLIIDTDGDILTDYEEAYIYLSSPIRKDSDFDLINDYDEVMIYNTSPIDPDCDDDNLNDGKEILLYLTNPLLYDTDGDGYSDFEEIQAGTNPLDNSSNPSHRLFVILISTFSGIIGILLLYYLLPYLFLRINNKGEKEWMRQGIETRKKKHDEMLNGNNEIS
ncbi:MAG: hypothetical protein JXA54_02980 [Candidatus Heimdallarchaeota archaeon]|nr:hypothetical protein [Candidatus Heimdallarchaeota archaeon]